MVCVSVCTIHRDTCHAIRIATPFAIFLFFFVFVFLFGSLDTIILDTERVFR